MTKVVTAQGSTRKTDHYHLVKDSQEQLNKGQKMVKKISQKIFVSKQPEHFK